MLDRSYALVFSRLTRKKQKEILESGAAGQPDE